MKIAKVLRLKRKKRAPPMKEIQRGFEKIGRRKFRYSEKGISGLTKYLVEGTISTEAQRYTIRKKKC
jgi:hypothetical protein